MRIFDRGTGIKGLSGIKPINLSSDFLSNSDKDDFFIVRPLLNITKNEISVIGKNADTIRIEKFGVTYLAFHAKDMIEKLANEPSNTIKLEVVGRANLNHYAGRTTPQIFIEDYQIDDGTLGF